MEKILENPWIITIVGGIAVAIFVYLFLKNSPSDDKNKTTQSSNQSQNVTQTVVIGKNENLYHDRVPQIEDLGYLKAKTKILFIEDDVFKKIGNLKNFGWNVFQIDKVGNLDIEEIKTANIIFVDYKGVGELSGNQGLGVVERLKEMYGNTKWIIFYSAHKLPLDVYDKGADDFLPKNANVYEMESKIIKGAQNVIK